MASSEVRTADEIAPRSSFRIVFDGLARAPLRMKLVLALNVLIIAVLGVSDFVDNVSTEVPQPYARATALVLLMGGALVLGVASVLWTLSQKGAECRVLDLKLEAFRMRARRLDEVLVAFPVLAFIAGCLVVAAMGMYTAVTSSAIARGVVFGVGVGYVLWAAGMIATTTRFLYTHAREQAEAAERARREATESQLAALQAQMNPHFLFNTLNTVASLIRTDSRAAEATVENLATVLRRTLDRSQRVLSTVDDEIDYIAAYLSVAKQRFGNRLHVHWSVDQAARELLLPTMALQPLVENALQHGIGSKLEGGALHIGVHVEGGERLHIEVADDGPGFPRRYREGTGLANTRERLATLFGASAGMEIDRAARGSRVVVWLPVVRGEAEALALSGASDAAAPVPVPPLPVGTK